jgi:hypothetical protein
MGAPTSKAAVKFPPVQVTVVEKNNPQLHPVTDIFDVEIVSCAGEKAVLEASCAHFSSTSVAPPPPVGACTKAICVPSTESVTEVLIVPPFVLYAQYPEGTVPRPLHPLYRLL